MHLLFNPPLLDCDVPVFTEELEELGPCIPDCSGSEFWISSNMQKSSSTAIIRLSRPSIMAWEEGEVMHEEWEDFIVWRRKD